MSIADRRPRVPGADTFTPVQRAVVVGAGTMGSGIAAHLANCGIAVTLLDVVPEGEGDRSRLARAAVDRQVSGGGFMLPGFADRVTPGNTEDHLDACADADWIIEAVFEDEAVKHDLYRRLEQVRRPGTLVSSNTSTMPLAVLTEGHSDAFLRDFTITHFFNPPRAMELLEVVAGPHTDRAIVERVHAVGDRQLGKTVLDCRDTPGFIANRIGSYWMSVAALEAFRAGLDIETADAVMSRPFGIPRTGIFGLFDLVGINLVPLLWPSMTAKLPASDAYHRNDITTNRVFTHLLEHGLVGRRGPGGFHRRRNEAGEKVDEVLDLESLTYRPRREATDAAASAGDLAAVLDTDSPGGRYALTVLAEVIDYACTTAPEIAPDVAAIDEGMRLGFGWKRGPFELADSLGVGALAARLEAAGHPVPPLLARAVRQGGFYPAPGRVLAPDGTPTDLQLPEGIITVDEAARTHGVLADNGSARLVPLGDGIVCLELRTKMNVCDPGVIEMVEQAVARGSAGGFRALVIGSDSTRAFSSGADLGTFVRYLDAGDADGLRAFAVRGQQAFEALRRAPFPVVAAARGFALGGGCELMLTADRVVAHAELYAGFPERKVGLIPAWGGVTVCLRNAGLAGETDPAAVAFRVTSTAEPGTSAWQAGEWHILRGEDEVVAGGRRVLAEAVAVARLLADGYTAPARHDLPLHDPAAGALDAGWSSASETDRAIVGRLAALLTGRGPGDTATQDALLAGEIAAATDLLARPLNQERVRHLLATNRPLAN